MHRVRRKILLICIILRTSCAFADPARPFDCGINCLFVSLKAIDPAHEVSLTELRSILKPEVRANSIEQLRAEADRRGFSTVLVRPTLESLRKRERPFMCIAHLKREHFVILKDFGETTTLISDPPLDRTVPTETFSMEWSGVCLLIADRPLEAEPALQRRLYWFRVMGNVPLVVALLTAGTLATMWVRRHFRRKRPT